jgi:hypothetical protein
LLALLIFLRLFFRRLKTIGKTLHFARHLIAKPVAQIRLHDPATGSAKGKSLAVRHRRPVIGFNALKPAMKINEVSDPRI